MYIITLRSLLVSLLAVFLSSQLVYAQSPTSVWKISSTTTPPTVMASPADQAVLVADVNLVDLSVQEKGGTYTGTYNLQGGMGQQNNIRIGVVVYDAKRSIVDVKTLVSDISVNEGDLKPLTVSYTLPKALSGKVSVSLQAETKDGLVLSQRLLGEKTLSGKGSTFLCSAEDVAVASPRISCTSFQKDSLSLRISSGSLFDIGIAKETKPFNAEEKSTFAPTLTPGNHYAFLTSETTGEMQVLKVRVSGTYGAFVSVVVNDTTQGALTITALTKLGGISSAKVTAVLTSKDKECGKGEATITSAKPVAVFDISSTCQDGTVVVNLVDAGGNVLDSRKEAFSVLSVDQIAEKAKAEKGSLGVLSPKQVTYVGLGALLLAVLLFLWWFGIKRKELVPLEEGVKISEEVKEESSSTPPAMQ